jgi:hypothetical protein
MSEDAPRANAVDCPFCGQLSEDVGDIIYEDQIPDCPNCGEYPMAVMVMDCEPPCDPEGEGTFVDENHHWGRYRMRGKKDAHIVEVQW